jgi:hypothetical protein
MITVTTATSTTDWAWTEIEIRDDCAELLVNVGNTPEQYTIFQQGVNEGWITIIGPEQ